MIEIEILKLLGVKPVRVGEDGKTEKIEFDQLSPEELWEFYGVPPEILTGETKR